MVISPDNTWFLIETGEHDEVKITPFHEYKDARKAMTDAYNEYQPNQLIDSENYIKKKKAYIDCSYAGWQKHWTIVSLNELTSTTKALKI